MKTKVVPRPRDVEFLRRAQLALPMVPNPVEDCCARLVMDCDVPSQDDAREHVTFLQALGLAAETDGNYHSTRAFPEDVVLRERFRERIFLADDVVSVVEESDGAVTAEAAFDAVREQVPRWERSRHTDWKAEWTERVDRILAWAAALGLIERDESVEADESDESATATSAHGDGDGGGDAYRA